MAFTEITVSPSAPMPKGYWLLRKGYAFMTALCRRKTMAAGRILYVVRSGSTTLGLRAPRHIINEVFEEERQTRDARRAAVTARDETTRCAFEVALRRQFPGMPAEEADRVLQRTLRKRSGRVGRSSKLGINDKAYYPTEKTFIERQPHVSEIGNDMNGNPIVNPYIADRLRNEAAVLRYLREKTTIPVPEVLDLQTANGLVYLKMAWIEGAVQLDNVPASRIDAAVALVTAQLESEVLPQLRSLRSRRMGSPDESLPLIPPQWFWEWKEDRVWPSIPGDYVFCHMDLGRQNILVHPETYTIVAIVDWETAGFFPQAWELPLWKPSSRKEKFKLMQATIDREKNFFSS